jgi:hypothetical protein
MKTNHNNMYLQWRGSGIESKIPRFFANFTIEK